MTDLDTLRKTHYNATLVQRIDANRYTRILRIRPDRGVFAFAPGQYVTLGLGYWEPRVQGAPPEVLPPGQERKVCRRAYSLSHPVVDDRSGELVAAGAPDFLEFYVTLIENAVGPHQSPALTPRLWMLEPGDRLQISEKPVGHYSLDPVGPDDDVVFVATGTGEAPHNAMVWDLLRRGHRGRIAWIVSARYRSDLAYRAKHEALERRHPAFRYFALTTREPENRDRKVYIQQFVESGQLERELGWTLDPARTHVFLCGNPSMIGIPEWRDGRMSFPRPRGMVEVLAERRFRPDNRRAHLVGNVHFEEYW